MIVRGYVRDPSLESLDDTESLDDKTLMRAFGELVQQDCDRTASLEQLQDLLAHQIPNGDPAAIVEQALDVLLTEVRKRGRGAALLDSGALSTAEHRSEPFGCGLPALN